MPASGTAAHRVMSTPVKAILPVPKDGYLRVEVMFDKPTTCPLVLIAMIEKQSSLTLEKSGKCTLSTI